MKTRRATIPGPVGPLEATVEEAADAPHAVAVVCHPHPVYGGTMTNKVTHTLARSFVALGSAAVRFNFRGVGESAGTYDDGCGETDDALAALDWAAAQWPDAALWLGGFSFGSWISLRAVNQRPVTQLVTVAPPVHRFDFTGLEQPQCPWLLIQGSDDELVDADAVIDWVNTLAPGPAVALLDGVDHFFHGHLRELKSIVLRSLAEDGSC